LQPRPDAKAYADAYCVVKLPGITKDTCISLALIEYETQHPRDQKMAFAEILVIDLATIALGWLIAWGCIALGRWVHRGFAAE
jgi:hypothetical protein